MACKALSILGSTGSIGVNTLEVIRQFPNRFSIIGLAAGRNVALLFDQILEFQPRVVAVMDEACATRLRQMLESVHNRPEVLSGADGYQTIAALPEVNMVVAAMVGAAGLVPTVAAIEAGKHVALANKETLVIGGSVVVPLTERRGVRLLPVDSEHSAIFQSLQGNQHHSLRRILLTASGGPFFRKSMDELSTVTPQAALKHPNWSMGRKITIDSATLMNKGLEVIEAHWLFNVPVDQIAVHIHPESIIHSMVEYVDGSVIAQLGIPDMKTPIAYALSYPERLPLRQPALDLFQLQNLSFYPPDETKFPCLRLAYQACREGSTMPAVLNAANEVAVEAFLNERIGFLDIPTLIESTMSRHSTASEVTLQSILEADHWARKEGERMIHNGLRRA
ncbi:MAG TPA: 1-deoxy-D-xylulose-5-phosphate reductoisomerase [Syntrophobacteraceae bacterium]|nr:1-deoxy-D-xylulose-5-phosphate reductoisomerase [Syntrophobacteraceae bacterium]HBD07990.1 1-deoxy-D-xylulose-5-phosphate reductoisomerase [Syntrophobacteraceae bacterium]